MPVERIAAIWPPLKNRLREEELLQQLPNVLCSKYFTEESFEIFYQSLPLPNRLGHKKSGEDKFQALIGQVRDTGRAYDLINWIRTKHPGIPLTELVELPPVHRLGFVNREDELEESCGRYAPAYILYEAPAGYGKTELLEAIMLRPAI